MNSSNLNSVKIPEKRISDVQKVFPEYSNGKGEKRATCIFCEEKIAHGSIRITA